MAIPFRDRLRKRVAKIRAIPFRFGVRPYFVAVEVKSWSGDERGEGLSAKTLVKITEANGRPPKIRWLNSEEIALGGFEQAAVRVGPITPGNTPREALEPCTDGNDTVHWILTGPRYPNGAKFALRDVEDHRGYQFNVILEKVAD